MVIHWASLFRWGEFLIRLIQRSRFHCRRKGITQLTRFSWQHRLHFRGAQEKHPTRSRWTQPRVAFKTHRRNDTNRLGTFDRARWHHLWRGLRAFVCGGTRPRPLSCMISQVWRPRFEGDKGFDRCIHSRWINWCPWDVWAPAAVTAITRGVWWRSSRCSRAGDGDFKMTKEPTWSVGDQDK